MNKHPFISLILTATMVACGAGQSHGEQDVADTDHESLANIEEHIDDTMARVDDRLDDLDELLAVVKALPHEPGTHIERDGAVPAPVVMPYWVDHNDSHTYDTALILAGPPAND